MNWISVKDRMPGPNERVFVYFKNYLLEGYGGFQVCMLPEWVMKCFSAEYLISLNDAWILESDFWVSPDRVPENRGYYLIKTGKKPSITTLKWDFKVSTFCVDAKWGTDIWWQELPKAPGIVK